MNTDLKKAIGVFFIGLLTLGIGNLLFLYRFSGLVLTDADGKIIIPMRELVLNLLTLGIYGAVWSFKIGQKLDALEGNDNISSQTIISVIFSVIFLRCATMANIYYRIKLCDIGV